MSLKQSVLQILENNRDSSVSGQQLADKLQVSRAAIWKAINSLKEEGYSIYATTNKGYRLYENTDLLSSEGIIPHLKESYSKLPIIVYKTIDSTNSQAKKQLVTNAVHGTVIAAEEQTNGRGRMGRSFYSPSKTGIYMSLILRPHLNISNAVLITTASAVAVCRAIKSLTDKKPEIKWVNDIYVNGKKVCGILTEAVTDFESRMVESIIIGIGINFKTTDEHFPDEIRETAGSLFTSESTGITRNRLIAEIINELLDIYDNLEDSNFIMEYKAQSMILGKEIVFYENSIENYGKAIDIDNSGGLVVETKKGEVITLNSGEITVRRLPIEDK